MVGSSSIAQSAPHRGFILLCSWSFDHTRSPPVHAILLPSNADHLQHLTPETVRRIEECRLVGVESRPFPNKIHFVWFDKFRSLDQFPRKEVDKSCATSQQDVVLLLQCFVRWLTQDKHGIIDEPALRAPRGVAGVSVTGHDHDHPR